MAKYTFRTKMRKIVELGTCINSNLECKECPIKEMHCRDEQIVDFARKWLENHKVEQTD